MEYDKLKKDYDKKNELYSRKEYELEMLIKKLESELKSYKSVFDTANRNLKYLSSSSKSFSNYNV